MVELEDHREKRLVKDRLLLTAMLGALVGGSLSALGTYAALTAPESTIAATGAAAPSIPVELAVPAAGVVGLLWAGYGYVQVRSEWENLGVLD